MITGELNYQEAREALEQLYESANADRRFVLRIYVLYAFNDEYARKGLKYLEDSEDYRYFVENCREMIKMSQTNPTLRAELYREIGEFEQCVQYLDSIEPVTGYENEVREQIRKRALDGDRMVFQLG
jgi:flagellar motor component MotA